MKRNDLLLLGAVGLAAFFLLKPKAAAVADESSGGGGFDLGSILDSVLKSLPGMQGIGALGDAVGLFSPPTQFTPTLADYRSGYIGPAALTARWTAILSNPPSQLAGITSYGAYNPAAIAAAPTARLTDMGASVRQIGQFAAERGGSVGTAYSAGSAIPVAIIPVRGSTYSGLYTTAEAYISQATGQKPSVASAKATPAAAALTPAQRMARGLW